MSEPDAEHYVSKRADMLWRRMAGWYGDKLKQFGTVPPADWCELIDASRPEAIKLVMASMPRKHPTWPPTFGEFQELFRRVNPDERVAVDWTQRIGEFVEAVCRKHWDSWTPRQRHHKWEYLYAGDARSGEGYRFIGIRIPADPDRNRPAFTYTLDEFAP